MHTALLYTHEIIVYTHEISAQGSDYNMTPTKNKSFGFELYFKELACSKFRNDLEKLGQLPTAETSDFNKVSSGFWTW